MINKASFQTRARTIDHLGRGQIADAPTAISELWKNAYDAYARDVELHIFDGETIIAAIIDNGHGMKSEELLDNWLVVGTDSKVGKGEKDDEEDRFGLPERKTQGEKGIGRLSAAFLSPMTLMVTKRVGHPFAAILVDWRLFENPYLLISDVEFPIIEFGEINELPQLLPEMFEVIAANVNGDTEDEVQHQRLKAAWDSFDQLEKESKQPQTTREAILSLDNSDLLSWDHMFPWWEMMKKVEEHDLHGTAMLAIVPNSELACWVRDDYQSEDAEEVKKNLRDTLISFTDPYSNENFHFQYAVEVHAKDKPVHTVIDSKDAFSSNEFRSLEHYVEGAFDRDGVFNGRVKAFGKDIGGVEVRPTHPVASKGRARLGAFDFCIGTIEFDYRNSTLSEDEYVAVREKANRYGGICMYRDGLRVLPYGREGADLFGIEFRRSRHAGREFFSYRRSFGRMSFTSNENPNLKDKAGREGLVDNKARREMVRLVKNLLMTLAREFFGTNSTIRFTELPEIQKRNAARRRAAEKARKISRKVFSSTLQNALPMTIKANDEAHTYLETFELAERQRDTDALSNIKCEVDRLDALRDDMRLPNLPASLGEDEEAYREFRDVYAEFNSILERLKKELARCEAEGLLGDPHRIVLNKFHSNESRLSNQVGKSLKKIENHLDSLKVKWNEHARNDRQLYNKQASEFVARLDKGDGLTPVLNMLDGKFIELQNEIELKYSRALTNLFHVVENSDLESAFSWVDKRNANLEEKVEMLHGVAQMGISVEIIGHELESLESDVSKYMRRLPKAVRDLTSYKLALEAFSQLTDRLKFLTPLKKTAYRSRINITGKSIGNYLKDFFGDTFSKYRVDFIVTPAFERMVIRDLPSRIHPTFINLINNALYWVQYGERRIIQLDFVDGLVIVADTGKGVDPDDLEQLFQLFFSRRSNGRGIGLYLCRQNLAVAHHAIRYAEGSDPRVLEGANFIIEFKGVENA